jgi:peptidoglycan hydrolase FlgJ
MEISSLIRPVQASELPLERLAASSQLSQKDKIGEVSRQFEAVLLRQILSQAQKPMFKSSLMAADGTTNAIYQDMVTQQLADRISQGGTFGFAKVLEQQLSVEYGGTNAEQPNGTASANSEKADAAPEQKVRKYISPAIQPGKRI